MSTVGVGKDKEREVCKGLRDVSWAAERVRGSGGGGGTITADVVGVPRERMTFVEHNRIVKAIEEGEVDRSHLEAMEVKYKTDGSGFKSIYDVHLRSVGLGGVRPVQWECGHLSGGFVAWAAWQSYGEDVERWHHSDTVGATVRGFLEDGAETAAMRMARKPWILVWR